MRKWGILGAAIITTVAGAQQWQQGVRYTIRAVLIPAETLLQVHTRMVYRNNSPDTLRELYVHLYWNIFAPQSYARQLSRERRLERIPELPPVQVDSFLVIASTGERRKEYDVDNTIVRLLLPRPLPPGDSVEVISSIAQRVPPEGFRMGRYEQDYFIAHWFPSVCVYDRYGWHTEQYLGIGEFYEEIADFEVELTVPGTYLVVHTGVLQNAVEVLPQEVLRQLDRARADTAPVRIADYALSPPADTTPRVWRFYAERVRTVAWAAVRRYLWDVQQWEGILVHVLYPKQLESFYRDEGLRAAVHAVRYFSTHFGRYPYPNMFVVVGGTSGGMEYPGIVFIGRGLGGGLMAPRTAEVIMHEIGHNWYPMMVNSNETEFGFQDEGFNTFITALALESFYGRERTGLRLPGWLRPFIGFSDEYTGIALSTILWQLTGWDEPLLTRSDWHRTAWSYSINAYPKTASLLFMLRGVLGRETFSELLREYTRRYQFRHVYPQDFAQLAAEIASRRQGQRMDLRWFFDQWYAQTPIVDYALAALRNEPAPGGAWDVRFVVERRATAMLPVEVQLRLADGTKQRVRLSEEEFLRGVPRVERSLRLPAPAVEAVLDPDTALLLDVNRLNNRSGFLPPLKARLFVEALSYEPPELYAYAISWQPALGFNTQDGLKVGLEVRGGYLGLFHRVQLSVLQGLRFRPHSLNATFSWRHLLWQLPGRPYVEFRGSWQEGWWRFRSGATLDLNPQPPSPWRMTARFAVGYWRRHVRNYAFPQSPLGMGLWSVDRAELVITKAALTVWREFLGWSLRLRGVVEPLWYREPGFSALRPAPFTGGRSFFRTTLEMLVQTEPPVPVLLRGAIGWFAPDDESRLFPPMVGFRLASVTPIEELELPLYRSPGLVSSTARQRRTAPSGGAFLRGYVPQDSLGRTMVAVNGEVGLTPFLSHLPGVRLLTALLDIRLFADAGIVGDAFAAPRQWRADAGVSLEVRLPRIPGSPSIPLLHRLGIDALGLDIPFFVTHPPAGERRWAFRWALRFRLLQQAFVEW